MRRIIPLLAALALGLSACSAGPAANTNPAPTATPTQNNPAKQLTVFATTGYLADAVTNIAPEAKTITMVGPGGDPHEYQPSTKDIENLKAADIVLWNGLYLEAQMIDTLKGLGDKQLAVGETIPKEMLLPWPEKDHEGNALHDPHIWNSPAIWQKVVTAVADKLSSANPDQAGTYTENAKAYNAKIAAAAETAAAQLKAIPKENRVLITGHDAFNYFGKTFDLEVHATDFVSTTAQRSATEIKELADTIVKHKLPTIFLDNQANPQAITSLKEAVHAKGWKVNVSAEELFADSLGESAPVDTYLGVFAHNATAISAGLAK